MEVLRWLHDSSHCKQTELLPHLHAVVHGAANAWLRVQQSPDLRQHHLPQGVAAQPAKNEDAVALAHGVS